jgi:uncharacterized protein
MDLTGLRFGIRLFNCEEFFEAHEALEDVWRAAPDCERKFLQGLIQIAVAFHHFSTGNLVGAQSLLARGTKNLTTDSNFVPGIQMPALRHSIERWQVALSEGGTPPPFPKIELEEAGLS